MEDLRCLLFSPARPARSRMAAADGPSSLLLVDDEPTFRRVLRLALNRRGFAVVAARGDMAVLDLARIEPPEYAIMDLNRPTVIQSPRTR